MLKRTKYRALSPGQWARTRIPDYECWKEAEDPFYGRKIQPGEQVDICIVPCYVPRHNSDTCFHWDYRVAWRRPKVGAYPIYAHPRGSWISPWDFGLHECTKFNFNIEEYGELRDGKGKYLYEPASDDPELCPGGDYSAYYCDKCERYQQPFSNDDGELGCPYCDTEGLVIIDEGTLSQLEQAREFARSIGLLSQLEHQLEWLATYAKHEGSPRRQCILGGDFATYSFSFAHYELPNGEPESKRRFWFNGGLIYQGPTQPADGSFPSLTVSLHRNTGWFCHT
jgi:hypothetical protein